MDSAQAKLLAEELLSSTICGWSLLEVCGTGKSAVVFRAQKGDSTGAIKIFHPELVEKYGKASQLDRINREKQLIGLNHPNLVKILDGGESADGRHLFVVMEYLPFKNLKSALLGMPEGAIDNIIYQIASAAQFIESLNLVHRDIKPENIAISDDYSRAVLLDFGIIRPIGIDSQTDADRKPFIGTLQYSPPEFLERKEIDSIDGWRALTFYQLGAVLHDMLMKKPIFNDFADPYPSLVLAITREAPLIHSENTRCAALARHCLVKNPATRLQIVSWSNFEPPKQSDNHLVSKAQERIRAHQRFARETTQSSITCRDSTREMIQRQLEAASDQFRIKIAELTSDLYEFPAKLVKFVIHSAAKTCSFSIQFERDDSIGLSAYLIFRIDLVLIDEFSQPPIFEARSYAALSRNEDFLLHTQCANLLFRGELEELLARQQIKDSLFFALDRAYNALESCSFELDVVELNLQSEEDESE